MTSRAFYNPSSYPSDMLLRFCIIFFLLGWAIFAFPVVVVCIVVWCRVRDKTVLEPLYILFQHTEPSFLYLNDIIIQKEKLFKVLWTGLVGPRPT